MSNEPTPLTSMFELLVRAALADRSTPASKRTPSEQPAQPANIVDRRDERGTPYKGDFPHPLGDQRGGCF